MKISQTVIPKKPIIHKGKQYASIEDLGKQWWAERKAENWQETECGLLPPEEVALSGMVKTPNGKWAIPACEYISEQKTDSLNKGQKYIGPTRQFINWKNRYFPASKETDVEDYANYSDQEELGQARPIKEQDVMQEIMDLL